MQQDYDIVIVGAGMVGLACAVALADLPLKIAIIENKTPNFSGSNDTFDLRVSAINLATLTMLIKFDLWKNILAQRASAYEKMFVWTDNTHLEFTANSINRPELGFIIENRIIRQALWDKVIQQDNIEILCPITLTAANITTTNAQLMTTEDHKITANLIIGADGANSWLRNQLNLLLNHHDYHQHALVTTVTTKQAHQKTAWQHFLPQGPLAFLPLSEPHYCSIVWSTTATQATQLKQCSAIKFNQAISTAFTDRLGSVSVQADRITFPLTMQHLKNYVAPHLAFIGDAAHRIHPLAGQGVNLGFMDALCLAKNIKNALLEQKDFSTLAALQRYQRERKYYNTSMLILMDILKHSFTNSSKTLSQLRNIMLQQLNKQTLIKHFLIEQALGTSQLPQNYLGVCRT